jgi:putative ABC transport system substrate-binding protein
MPCKKWPPVWALSSSTTVSTPLASSLSRVMSFVTASGKPSVGPYPDWGRAGLLMSCSTDPVDCVRHAGIYAAKG